jgi:hypothetical protein
MKAVRRNESPLSGQLLKPDELKPPPEQVPSKKEEEWAGEDLVGELPGFRSS